jgi:hypothetical protein
MDEVKINPQSACGKRATVDQIPTGPGPATCPPAESDGVKLAPASMHLSKYLFISDVLKKFKLYFDSSNFINDSDYSITINWDKCADKSAFELDDFHLSFKSMGEEVVVQIEKKEPVSATVAEDEDSD